MSFVAQCGFCKHKVKAPEQALGASVRCKKCASYFTLAPIEEAPPEQVLGRFRRRVRASAPAAGGETPAAAGGTTKVMAEHASSPSANGDAAQYALEDVYDPSRAWRTALHALGAGALALSGVGLACASLAGFAWLTVPVSITGLVIGLSGLILAGLSARSALPLPVAGSMLALAVLVTALFFPQLLGPVFEARRQPPAHDRQAMVVVPVQSAIRDTGGLQQDGWTDASQAALHQGQVRVQVASASVAAVPFQGGRPTFSKEKQLIVHLLIQHVGGGGPLDYVHWGLDDSPKADLPTLTEERGTALPLAGLRATELPIGQVRRAKVHPGRFVEDVLVFAVPSEGVGVRLRLPAIPWKGAGEMKFLIPSSMIQR